MSMRIEGTVDFSSQQCTTSTTTHDHTLYVSHDPAASAANGAGHPNGRAHMWAFAESAATVSTYALHKNGTQQYWQRSSASLTLGR